jgi:sugar phosphate isomerase/epimerase
VTIRVYSLAYLTVADLAPPQMIDLAAALGYSHVGLRLLPNAIGAPFQPLLDDAAIRRETVARVNATGVSAFDLEIVRIGNKFTPDLYLPLFEAAAALKSRAVLVAGDDPDEARLAENFARLCETVQSFGLTANLEFMPWTAVPDARAALRVLDAAGRPSNAGVLVDALHFGRSATTLADIRALPREHLNYLQICDAIAGRHFTAEEMIHDARSERQLPGDGTIELDELFRVLPADLPVSVEVPNRVRVSELGEREWARRALAASRALLERAG